MATKIDALPNRLAGDIRGSQDLRAKFRDDPQAGLKAAAQEFEAMFLQMVLKSMRDATPQDGMLNSDSSRFYTSMLDQQLAQNMSRSEKGLGFAKLIEQQLGRQMNAAQTDSSGVTSSPSATTSAPALGMVTSNERHLAAARFADMAQQSTAAISSQTSATNSPSAGSGTTKEFVDRVWPYAVEASRATGVPPHFLVAHAALESGWGKSEPRNADGSPSFNLFGIKAGKGWGGSTADASTTEYVDGQAQKTNASFRAYSSYAESFSDYANLLRNNPRYGNVVGSQDGTEFAKRLQQAGYATDPAYADKLSRIINGPALRQALIG